MKNRVLIFATLLSLISAASYGQYRYRNIDKEQEGASYLKLGTQIPLQHSIIYDHRITPAFSLNGGLGFIAAPYPKMITNNLEGRGLISANDKAIINRSFQSGISFNIGANFHFDRNYVRLSGQLIRLNGDMSIPDLASLYFRTDMPPIVNTIAQFINPIDIKSNIPMVGLLYGRRFPVGDNAEIHAELSLAKTLGHSTTYKTGTFIDDLEVVNDIVYNELDNDLDNFFQEYGWIPSLNVYYVFKF